MIRLGLCCLFLEEPIKFRTSTAAALARKTRPEQLAALAALCRHNAEALHQAISFCARNAIGAFRVNSRILPLKTHPEVGYDIKELPEGDEIIRAFKACGKLRKTSALRLSFHPDQFVLLNSPRPDVLEASLAELAYQAQVASWIGADVINIHGGGAYGDKPAALQRLAKTISKLPAPVKSRLTLENDDRTYTPAELLPVCRQTGIPLVYDVHHHRCLPDGNTIEHTTRAVLQTWNREPLFHISSPRAGWSGGDPKPHHDYIDINDFPPSWANQDFTLEIEAKAKEIAVKQFQQQLLERYGPAATAMRQHSSTLKTSRTTSPRASLRS